MYNYWGKYNTKCQEQHYNIRSYILINWNLVWLIIKKKNSAIIQGDVANLFTDKETHLTQEMKGSDELLMPE